MDDTWVENMGDLPALPAVVQRLLATMSDEMCSAENITAVISADQALASQVLKLVNAPSRGVPEQIVEVSRAVVLLGFAEIRSLALSLGVVDSFKAVGEDLDLSRFWEHAATVASGAKVLAQRIRYGNPEEAFIAGLLHDVGQLVLAVRMPDNYAQVSASSPLERVENERKLLGITHPRAGRKLMTHWNLPKPLCEVVRNHHNERAWLEADATLLGLVALADTLARILGQSDEQPTDERTVLRLAKNLDLDLGQIKEILAKTSLGVDEMRIFLDIDNNLGWQLDRPDRRPRKLRAVIICSQPQRHQWIDQLLTFHRNDVVPMEEFFARIGEADPVDLIVLDPRSITRDQMVRLRPLLKPVLDKMVVYGDQGMPTVSGVWGRRFPVLKTVFNQADLLALSGR